MVNRSSRQRFRELLRKIGSGEHTSRGLSREEAAEAMALMLNGDATPAQMGAFLIAHRIRRPEPQELAGMLDHYDAHGPSLRSQGRHLPICFGMPYDGRTRTAPVFPLTALVLAAAGHPVILHGGRRMPIKYGITPMELFQYVGIDFSGLAIAAVQHCLDRENLALTHQPLHFPEAETLVEIRDELGKRPPVASLELLWSPHKGAHLLVSGFVHPPTESRAWAALAEYGERNVVTVKGLEGSTDIPTSRAGILAHVCDGQVERQIFHPRDHGYFGADLVWSGEEAWSRMAEAALEGHGPLCRAVIWNSGSYLWLLERERSLPDCLAQAAELLAGGQVRQKRDRLCHVLRSMEPQRRHAACG
ncbi:MAG: anthranilate phosphoribosyltransferase family protein [Synechococcus sp. SB0673_bin_10]|uniref:Anthranilate phosphoribosyltransferase family protein n=1 Tax=Synechococcus sp. SB0676_bin_10 TaxID=2604869 RepID=A0A6B1F9H8_9SYNE|nr:anthranilate phosphoribosyltransferase family protein [Cyanobacteria bacterium MAG IRC3_bin_20]MDE0646535.1 anthranilate phosphoribosyltransferase family protein [Cyanobacteria bacterium MAG IRC4_bin_6]MXW12479.1 anthranilate phosphoribosyltransferase family protein [Synechococcus sp. SB0668_bin_13]MXX08419.1 anthranilate phosphoribosyltransferase family protein [Synechococcus sp. SB0667_bin_8]MXY19234.1 anthranilate phosphoribosyltransferase family protein [Synechococcus sp. SB0664_bin_36]